MTDLNSEISGIKKTEPNEIKWLQDPYIGMVQIKDLRISEDVKKGDGKPYTGKPFFQFLIATKEGERTWIIFWREVDGEDEKNLTKREKLKSFLENAKADEKLEGMEYLKSVINQKLQMCLKKKDEIITNKAGIPEIRSNIFYSYSAPATEQLTADISKMYYRLSDEDRAKFEKMCAEYESQTGTSVEDASKGAIEESKGEDFEAEEGQEETEF
jgi:hypothetical protein